MFFVAVKEVCVVLISAVELLWGVIRFSFLRRDMITFFGGHAVSSESELGKAACQVAYRMVEEGYGVFTGGGDGIMKEALRGAYSAKQDLNIQGKMSIGIVVKHLTEGRSCRYADYFLVVRTFFVRKWLLMNFSTEFIIFPGGFGTVDEFAEIVTLLNTQAMEKRKIILYGKEFWSGFLVWFDQQAIQKGFSDKKSFDLFEVVDSVDEAVSALKQCCEKIKGCENIKK